MFVNILLFFLVSLVACEGESKCKSQSIKSIGKTCGEKFLSGAKLDDENSSTFKPTVICPVVIGVGETLESDRILTSTNRIQKILVKKKIITCQPLQGNGKFHLKMHTYTDSKYQTLVSSKSGNEKEKDEEITHSVFYEILLLSAEHKNLIISPKSCYATAYPNPDDEKRYVFLKDGCPLDLTYKVRPSTDKQKYRFSIESFQFVGTKSKFFYVHCEVNICDVNLQDSCTKQCFRVLPRINEITQAGRTRREIKITKALKLDSLLKNRKIVTHIRVGEIRSIFNFNIRNKSLKGNQRRLFTVKSRKFKNQIFLSITKSENDNVKFLKCSYGTSRENMKDIRVVNKGCTKRNSKHKSLLETIHKKISTILKMNLLDRRFKGWQYRRLYLSCDIAVCSLNDYRCSITCEKKKRNRVKRDVPKNIEVSLQCGQDYMSVALKKPLPGNPSIEKLHLFDTTCKPSQNSTHIFITTKTFTCGTKFTKNGTTAIYENVLLENPEFIITRRPLLEIPFRCVYKLQRATSQNSLAMRYETPSLGFRSRAFGSYTVDIGLFTNDKFLTRSNSHILYIDPSNDMFFQVKIKSLQLKLDLFLDKCFGYPARRRNVREEYVFIQKGCSRDSTLKFYNASSDGVIRFSLKPFLFNDNTSSVIINCYVTACNVLDKQSKCRRGCNETPAR